MVGERKASAVNLSMFCFSSLGEGLFRVVVDAVDSGVIEPDSYAIFDENANRYGSG